MDPVRRQAENHAAIIGAGVAGLAASIRLAAMGMQVALLDRHAHPGGKIRTTPSDAGPVDAGPTVLTMRHVYDDLFAAAGARPDDHVELLPQAGLARHFWPDGSSLDLFADPERSAEAIGTFAGARAAEEFRAFCRRAAALFDAFDQPMMQAPEPRLSTLARHVLGRPSLTGQMAPLSTLAGLLRRQFGDPRLRQLFGRYATYIGGAPHLSPAVLALIWHAEASGVWAGDPRALATGALGPAVRHLAPATLRAGRSFSARVASFAARVEGPERFELIANAPATPPHAQPKDIDQWHQRIMNHATGKTQSGGVQDGLFRSRYHSPGLNRPPVMPTARQAARNMQNRS